MQELTQARLKELLSYDQETGWAKRVPMKRSSKLTTVEFQQYYQFIQRRCSETMGLYIPDPQHTDKNEVDDEL